MTKRITSACVCTLVMAILPKFRRKKWVGYEGTFGDLTTIGIGSKLWLYVGDRKIPAHANVHAFADLRNGNINVLQHGIETVQVPLLFQETLLIAKSVPCTTYSLTLSFTRIGLIVTQGRSFFKLASY